MEAESSEARSQSIWSASPRRSRRTRCSFSHTPASCHSFKRRQQVIPDPQPISFGSISQGIPLFSTKTMPVRAARSSMRGLPPWGFGGSGGRSGSMVSHSWSVTSSLAIFSCYPLNGFVRLTKSGQGRRVRLTRQAASALKDHRKRQLEELLRLAGLWQDQGLVFPNETGSLFNPSNLRNCSFKRIKTRANVREDLRFHDLRHTCATLLLSEGVNVKVVSELLGHASITITLNTYSHVLPDMQDSAADAMEAALS